MFLVGGGILVHGLPGAPALVEAAVHAAAALPGVGGASSAVAALLIDGLAGIAAGALVLAAIGLGKRLRCPA
jgi:predicted DNA repair protein MutK